MSGKLFTGTTSKFRKAFAQLGADVVHYFPTHMHKGLQQMQSKLGEVDCVIEVHDARIPFSGRNPVFSDTVQLRPHLLVLNKMDLANLSRWPDIEQTMQEKYGVHKCMVANCKQDFHYTVKHKLLKNVMSLLENAPRYNRTGVPDYNLLVIGVPNVGKSSLINALRRMHLGKGKATRVGGEAGITTSVLEKIKVSENPKVYVYDTPGILSPKVPNMEVGLKLALCATLRDHVVGEDMIADYLLFWLNTHEHFKYVKHFSLDEPTDDVLHLLAHVARQHNAVLKRRSTSGGGYVLKPDFLFAAKIVLKAFREGHLGKVNLDMDMLRKRNSLQEVT